ncbi:hypothetical protein PsYK624_067000 [Phanerochaete sordida]|uniref:Uncharacterized protein n=1 Tax=Phanerochaete sordida TaxID=48140 RepID=A0A9P3G9J8_9APHY|nr:hypothetical protein PsYK624_067000 [Phanerochaete sordida]
MKKLMAHLCRHWDIKDHPCPFQEGSSERHDPENPASKQCPFKAFDASHVSKHAKSKHSAQTAPNAAEAANAPAATTSGTYPASAASPSTTAGDAPTPGLTDTSSAVPSPMPTTPHELADANDDFVVPQVTGPAQASTSTALAHAPAETYPQVAAPPANAYTPAGSPSFTHIPAQAQINVAMSAQEQLSGSEGLWAMPITSAEVQAILASRAHNASLAAMHGAPHAGAVGAPAYASAHSSPRPAALRTARPSRYAPYAPRHVRPNSAAIAMPIAPPFDPAPRSYSAPAHDVVPGTLRAFDGAANASYLAAAQQPVQYSAVQHAPAQYAQDQPAAAHRAPAYDAAGAVAAQEFDAGYPNAWNVAAGAGYQSDAAAYAAPAVPANFAQDTYSTVTLTRATPPQSLAHQYDQLAPAYDEQLDAEPWHQFPLPNAPALSEDDIAKRLAEREAFMQQVNAYQPPPRAAYASSLPELARAPSALVQPALTTAGYQHAPLGADAVPRVLAAEDRGGDGEAVYQQAPDDQGTDAFGWAVHPWFEYGPC